MRDNISEETLASYIGVSGPETPKYLLANNFLSEFFQPDQSDKLKRFMYDDFSNAGILTCEEDDERAAPVSHHPPHHVQPGGVVAEDFFPPFPGGAFFAKVTVAGEVEQVIPAAVGKYLHVPGLVTDAVRVVVQAVGHFFRLAMVEMVEAGKGDV